MSRASEHCCPDEVWSRPSLPLHLCNATTSVKLHSAASSFTEPFLSLAIIATCSQLLFWIFFKSWPFVWFLNSHLPMYFLSSSADSSMCRPWPMPLWNPHWTGGIIFTLCFKQRRILWVPNLPYSCSLIWGDSTYGLSSSHSDTALLPALALSSVQMLLPKSKKEHLLRGRARKKGRDYLSAFSHVLRIPAELSKHFLFHRISELWSHLFQLLLLYDLHPLSSFCTFVLYSSVLVGTTINIVDQWSANFFCKKPDSKHFKLCELFIVVQKQP